MSRAGPTGPCATRSAACIHTDRKRVFCGPARNRAFRKPIPSSITAITGTSAASVPGSAVSTSPDAGAGAASAGRNPGPRPSTFQQAGNPPSARRGT